MGNDHHNHSTPYPAPKPRQTHLDRWKRLYPEAAAAIEDMLTDPLFPYLPYAADLQAIYNAEDSDEPETPEVSLAHTRKLLRECELDRLLFGRSWSDSSKLTRVIIYVNLREVEANLLAQIAVQNKTHG